MVLSHQNLRLTGIFKDIRIEDVEIRQAYNDHATIYLSGLIVHGDAEIFMLRELKDEKIKLIATQESADSAGLAKTVFCGILLKTEISHAGGLYQIKLYGISHSYLLDIKKESRSYQNYRMTYDEIVQTQAEKYGAQVMNEDPSKDEALDKFMLQYRETSWAFLKRIVSHHHLGLLPGINKDLPAFHIGLPSGHKQNAIGDTSFSASFDIASSKEAIENNRLPEMPKFDQVCYKLSGMYIPYSLGDSIAFRNKPYRIVKIHSHLHINEGIMKNEYWIAPESGCMQPLLFNEGIRGLALQGEVIDRMKDFTKIHLFTIDQQQTTEEATWFRQSAFYTAGKDRGWCAMPELGDVLFLFCPSTDENESYLLCSKQAAYDALIFPAIGNLSKSGMNPCAPSIGQAKTEQNIVDSKFINAPNGQSMLLENDMVHLSSQGGTSALSIFTNHKDVSGATLGIQLNTHGDMILTSKNLFGGETGYAEGANARKLTLNAKKHLILASEDSSVTLNQETGMADFYATEVKLLDGE